MRPQAFQAGEVRDEHDNIIRQGAYGKKTPFATADNSGILDYIINNFDVLDKGIKAAGIGSDENGNPTVSPVVSAALEAVKLSAANAKKSMDAAIGSEKNVKASESKVVASSNEAKTAASQAKTSATDAGHAMSTAATKAEEASVSAANAKTSETNAKTSETNAKTSETNAKTSETNAGKSATDATTKAGEASASATNAKASETAAKVSETNAKSSEGKAKTSETNAGASASTATQQATKATTEANRAKTEADRAKTAADSVGNPVVSITQSNGNLTVTKGDGSSDTLTVTPAKASQAEAEAGTDDIKMMTPLKVLQSIKKYIATFLMTAVFTGIIKGVTPPNDANDKTIPTTEWVQALLASKVMSLVVQDYLLEQNGYIRFRFGLILQWGYLASVRGNTNTTVSLPISCAPLHIVGSYGNQNEIEYVCSAWIEGGRCFVRSAGTNAKPIYWLCLGR